MGAKYVSNSVCFFLRSSTQTLKDFLKSIGNFLLSTRSKTLLVGIHFQLTQKLRKKKKKLLIESRAGFHFFCC